MNESSHHPKLRVSLTLGSVFVAGGDVYGKMDVECQSGEGVGLRAIKVELRGIQQLTSKFHAATSTFLQSQRLFQGPSLPPSNAVLPRTAYDDPDLPVSYFAARKGQTTFFFKFPLPTTSPSSIDFGNGLARISYEVKAGAEVSWRGERRYVTDTKIVDVVESFDEWTHDEAKTVAVGDGGRIWAQARIIDGLVVAGHQVCCELHVRNNSSRKISGVTVTLLRQLKLEDSPDQKDASPLQISDTLLAVPFRGPEYTVLPSSEGLANLIIDVPRKARGVIGGLRQDCEERDRTQKPSLFFVQCILSVKLGMGFGTPDVIVDLPIRIYHPSSIPKSYRYLLAPNIPSLSGGSDQLVPPQPYYAQEHPSSQPPSPQFLPYSPPLPVQYHAHSPGPGFDGMSQQPYFPPYSPPPVSPMYASPPQSPPLWEQNPYLDYRPNIYAPPTPFSQTHLNYYHTPVQSSSLPYIPRPASAELPTTRFQPPILEMPPILSSDLYNHINPTIASPPNPFRPMNEYAPFEDVKGERATRISRHLRLSSRHRSVSPSSRSRSGHLSPGSNPDSSGHLDLAHPGDVSLTESLKAIDLARSDVAMLDNVNVSLSQTKTPPPLLSPRPVLSPRQSYSTEYNAKPGVTGGEGGGSPSSRSERVVELERMVSQPDEADTAVGRRVEEEEPQRQIPSPPPENEINDTDANIIPAPPTIPSAKFSARVKALPAVMEIFGTNPILTRGSDALIVPSPHTARDQGAGGLTLLERRLKRAASPIPLENRGRKEREADAVVSRPALAPNPPASSIRRLESRAQSAHAPAPMQIKAFSASKPTASEPPARRKDTQRETKKEAKGRIAEWLSQGEDVPGGRTPGGSASYGTFLTVEAPPSARRSQRSKSSPRQSPREIANLDASPPRSLLKEKDGLSRTQDRSEPNPTLDESSTSMKAPPTVAISSNPLVSSQDSAQRTDLTLNHLASRPDLSTQSGPSSQTQPSGTRPVYPPTAAPKPRVTKQILSKYDVRSARGGRGGVVTSVTSLWSNLGPSASESSPNRVAIAQNDKGSPRRLNVGFKTLGIANDREHQPTEQEHASVNPSTKIRPSPNFLKAAGQAEPGAINPTLGRPIISPAAPLSPELLRKNHGTKAVNRDPERLPTTRSKDQQAFGQARLQGLIRRYQNG